MNLSIGSGSDISQGEQRPELEFEKIQQEIRKKFKATKQQIESKDPPALIDMDKLAPFLSQLTQVANHNLA